MYSRRVEGVDPLFSCYIPDSAAPCFRSVHQNLLRVFSTLKATATNLERSNKFDPTLTAAQRVPIFPRSSLFIASKERGKSFRVDI